MSTLRRIGLACAVVLLVATRQSWAGDDVVATFPLGDSWPIATLEIGGTSLKVILDTGCTRTTLDARYRGVLGEETGRHTAHSPLASSEVIAYACRDVRIGKGELNLADMNCMDLGPEIAAEGVGGVLGMDFLIYYCIDLDFDNGVARISKTIPEEIGNDPLKLKLTYDTHVVPQLRVKLSPTSETVAGIDTGGAGCIGLSQGDEKALFPEGLTPSIPSACFTVHGNFFCREARLPFVQIGSIRRTGLLCDFHNPAECKTTVGVEFLREFRVIFDFPHDTLMLLPRKETVVHESGMSGMSLIHGGRKLFVNYVAEDSPASDAGIRRGEEIVSINGLSTSEMSSPELRAFSRSGDGKVLKLRVRNRDEERSVELTLRRRI